MLVTIANLRDISKIRVLITALKAHGFHPMESGQDGLAGMPGVRGYKGTYAIKVPKAEAEDAKILSDDLIKEMESKD